MEIFTLNIEKYPHIAKEFKSVNAVKRYAKKNYPNCENTMWIQSKSDRNDCFSTVYKKEKGKNWRYLGM